MTFLVDAWAANKSAGAQEKAGKKGLAEQARQYDLTRSDQMPWLQTGTWALDQQKKALSGDWSGFMSSPDYQFALDQGIKGLDRSAAASGRLYSGGYGQDLTKYGQGMALQNYQNYMTNMGNLSGTGQQTAQNLGTLGQNYANSYANQQNRIGNARASAYQGYADAFNKGANQFGSWMGG